LLLLNDIRSIFPGIWTKTISALGFNFDSRVLAGAVAGH
jgi:hypothetical protein